MTVWDLVHAVRRQWALALVGLLVTLAGAYAASTAPGVYYQQTFVVFLPPEPRATPTQCAAALGGSLVEAAGLVGRQVSARPRGPVPVSTRVTIVDLGIGTAPWPGSPTSAAYSQWVPASTSQCSMSRSSGTARSRYGRR
jgi:hypothetical protein